MKITASLLSVFVGVGVASAGDSGLRSSTDQRILQDASPEIEAGNGAVTTGADISGGFDGDCDSIADAVCNLGDQYSTMCDIIKNETAMSSMDFGTKPYTVFIPDDTAWDLFQPSMAGLSEEEVGRIVSFHFYEGIELMYDELECTETLTAVTGDTSRTKCDKGHGDNVKHQNGNGNTKQESLPTITNSDITFCQGVAHTIDHLMLPVHLEEFVPVGSSDDHHKDNPDKMKSGGGGEASCNNGSTGYFWCDATNECLPPSDNEKCDEAECTAQSGSTGYSWCASTNTCLPPGDNSCDGGAAACNNGSTGYFWCDATNECLPPSDNDKCDKAECTAQSGSTGYSWCASTNTCLPPGDNSCDIVGSSYCTYAPDKECYASGWPECCASDDDSCPDTRPGCDETEAECTAQSGSTGYSWCASTKSCLPPGDNSCDIVGSSYCTYAPDEECYASGWPDCCASGDDSCPDVRPGCDTGR